MVRKIMIVLGDGFVGCFVFYVIDIKVVVRRTFVIVAREIIPSLQFGTS